ncbi:MAG: hypothetical protein ABIJ16_09985 [Bacteroidota bacterium]
MLHVESKIGKITKPANEIFSFLTDFNRIGTLLPPDKVTGFSSDGDKCRFSIEKAGDVNLKIIEKCIPNLIKIKGDGALPGGFFFWIQLKEIAANSTAIRLTVKADVNMMMKMMLKKTLKNSLDTLIDNLKQI